MPNPSQATHEESALLAQQGPASDASGAYAASRPATSMSDEEKVQYMLAKSKIAKTHGNMKWGKKSPSTASRPATSSGITSQRAADAYAAHEASRQQWRADNMKEFEPASMDNGMLHQAASAMAHDPHDDTNELGLKKGVSGGGLAAGATDLGLTMSGTLPFSPVGAAMAGKGLVRDMADMYRERDGGAHIEPVAKAQHEVRQEVAATRQQYAAAEEFRKQHASEPRSEDNADMHDLAGKLRGQANWSKARVGVMGGMKVDKAKRDEGMNSSPVREMTPEQQRVYEEMDADASKREKGTTDYLGAAAQGLRAGSEALEISSLAQIPLAGNTQKYVKSGQRGAAALSHASDAVSSTVGLAGPQATVAKIGVGAGGLLLANAGQALASGTASAQDDRDMAREKLDARDQGTGLEQIAERGFRPKHVEASAPVLRTFEDPDKRSYFDRMKDFASNTWNSVKSGASKAWEATKSGLSAAWDATKSGASAAWDATKSGASAAWEGTKSAASAAWEGTKSAASYVGGGIASGARAIGRGASAAGESIASGARSFGNSVMNGLKGMGRLRRPGRRPARSTAR